MNKIFFVFVLFNLGCSMEASISDLISKIQEPAVDLNRKEPDFIPGEIVTTSEGTPGFHVKGVFGEIGEKQEATTLGGWQVEGTFYE